MGMGFPVGMGLPWDSHGNVNEKHISMALMGMGMGMISVLSECRKICDKKCPLLVFIIFIRITDDKFSFRS